MAKNTLKEGAVSDEVRKLQQQLNARLAVGLKEDGLFGQATKTAVQAFQASQGLAVDGLVGPLTRQKLALAKASEVSAAEHQSIKQNLAISGRDFLSDDEAELIAERLNVLFDIPLLTEGLEAVVWLKVVRLLDRLLDKLLPDEIYHAVRDTAIGVLSVEPWQYRERLIDGIRRHISLPWLSESVALAVIGFFVDLVLDAIPRGRSLRLNPQIN